MRKKKSSATDKSSIRKNGSNYCPRRWSDEQIKNRGYTGRDDPEYVRLLEKKRVQCGLAGKANTIKNGHNFAPGKWTDEQIKNRGYTGRNDPRYLEKIKMKREESVKRGKESVGRSGCRRHGYGYKIDFIFRDKTYRLDSLAELCMLLEIFYCMPDETFLDTQWYYPNATGKFGGGGAIADIRTVNSKTGIITNWEIHNRYDAERIERKKYCTELQGDAFRLVPLSETRRLRRKFTENGILSEKELREIRYSNEVLKVPYKYANPSFDSCRPQSDAGK